MDPKFPFKNTMPPKQDLPDIIFVSESRTGAMLHHTRTDDLTNLILDHLKSSILIRPDPDPFFYFAAFSIECAQNLHFTKKFMIFSHDEFKDIIDELNIERVDVEAFGITELSSELERRVKEIRPRIASEIRGMVTEYINKSFT